MNDNILTLLRNRWTIPTAVGLTAFSGGIGVGYILGKRTPKQALAPVVQMYTIDEAVYAEKSDPIQEHQVWVVEPDEGQSIEAEKIEREEDAKESEPQLVNVFAADDEDWDYEAERSTRKGDQPYVLHIEEFFGEEMDYRQTQLTYFQGDDILVDENNVPIYNYASVVGELKFGHGSKDPNVVYVRNEKLRGEYEITLDEGQYSIEVLGHNMEKHLEDDDLKHSNVSRFRME